MTRNDTINRYFTIVLKSNTVASPKEVIQSEHKSITDSPQEQFTAEQPEEESKTLNEEPVHIIVEEAKEEEEPVKIPVIKKSTSGDSGPPALYIFNRPAGELNIFYPSTGNTSSTAIKAEVFEDSSWCIIPFSRQLMITGGSYESGKGKMQLAITLDTESCSVDVLPSM